MKKPLPGFLTLVFVTVFFFGTAWAGPPLGAHNDEVYGGLLGLSGDEIAGLTGLQWLRLERNNLSPEEKKRVKALLPRCHVSL